MTVSPDRCVDVEIADVARLIYAGPCQKLVAPAALGEVCILYGHAPLLTRLNPGAVRLQTREGREEIYFVSGGFMEVQHTTVTVLADQMLRTDEIDLEAALAAKKRAESVLKRNPLFKDRDAAQLQLVKALAQLRVLEYAERLHLHDPRRQP